MSDATNIDALFAYPYTLIKVDRDVGDYSAGNIAKVIYQCHYPEEMLRQFSIIDDFERKKAYYFVMDVSNVQLLGCNMNKAERELKRHIKGK